MALGTVTKIRENGSYMLIEVTIGSAIYVATIDKALFDAQLTALAKQTLVINVLSNARKAGRNYEDTFTTLIGTVVTIPD